MFKGELKMYDSNQLSRPRHLFLQQSAALHTHIFDFSTRIIKVLNKIGKNPEDLSGPSSDLVH